MVFETPGGIVAERTPAEPPFRHFVLCRSADIALAIAGLLFALPLMVLVAALLAVIDPGPVIFAQRRVGKDGRLFWCFKFRTMCVDAQERLSILLETDENARREWQLEQKLRNDPRISGIGRFLRASSLDELPQLVNVLRGDMSFVGPRPIVEAEVSRYGDYFGHYCSVRPGITGLWQISGRNLTTYERRVELDVNYVLNKRFLYNMRILALTVPRVVFSHGAF